jgi:hypothetical protein
MPRFMIFLMFLALGLSQNNPDNSNQPKDPVPVFYAPDDSNTIPDSSKNNRRLSTDEIIFREDVLVDSGQVSTVSMRIIGGNLTVYGTVNGKITLYGGDAYLKSGCTVNGEIATIGGNVYKEPDITINGKIIESNLQEGLIYRETDKESNIQGRTEFNLDQRSDRALTSWIHPKWPLVVYNRNEGFVFTPFNTRWDRHSLSSFRFSWSMGVRLHPGVRPTYIGRITLEKTFLINRNLILYSSAFKESRTDDNYRLPRKENSLAAFLARQDFYDRWEEKGWEVGLGVDFSPFLRLKFRAVAAEQDTLPLLDLYSLFQKKRKLRPGLSLKNQTVNYYELTLGSRTPGYSPLATGLAFLFKSEFIQNEQDSSSLFATDFNRINRRNFGLFIANWEFSPGLVLRARLVAGSTQGTLPSHRYFGVGGLGSVSAQSYKLQQGDMLAQLNLALMITPEFIGDDWLVTLFADGGHAWMKDDYSFDFDRIKKAGISSIGIGIGDTEYDQDLDWMINIAKPLDRSGPYETTLRINYSF